VLPQNKFRVLALTASERQPSRVRALAETVRVQDSGDVTAIFAPSVLPAAIVEGVNGAFNTGARRPRGDQVLDENGAQIRGGRAAGLASSIRQDLEGDGQA